MNHILPKGPFEVSEDQRSTITHCLYVAAERFEENAKSANEIETYDVRHLGEQFTRQALEARALAERIDNAEYIEIGPDTPDEPEPVQEQTPQWSLDQLTKDFAE